MSDTPTLNTKDTYEKMEALLCEMQGLRDELADAKRERDEAREALRLIGDDCEAWLKSESDEPSAEFIRLVAKYAREQSSELSKELT